MPAPVKTAYSLGYGTFGAVAGCRAFADNTGYRVIKRGVCLGSNPKQQASLRQLCAEVMQSSFRKVPISINAYAGNYRRPHKRSSYEY